MSAEHPNAIALAFQPAGEVLAPRDRTRTIM
jgi:hypothetical protein